MEPDSVRTLEAHVQHAKHIKYSSMVTDGKLRTSNTTRIDGFNVTLVPYRPEHVGVCVTRA